MNFSIISFHVNVVIISFISTGAVHPPSTRPPPPAPHTVHPSAFIFSGLLEVCDLLDGGDAFITGNTNLAQSGCSLSVLTDWDPGGALKQREPQKEVLPITPQITLESIASITCTHAHTHTYF